MPKPTRVVSIRVPLGLPEKVKAVTGMPFSRAVITMFEAFIAAQESRSPAPKSTIQLSNLDINP